MQSSSKTRYNSSIEDGFTLIEVVVVILILLILVLISIPKMTHYVAEVKKLKEIADARMLAGEVVTFNTEARLDGTTTIPNPLPASGTVELTKHMLDSTYLEIPDEDSFPDRAVVKIYIDSSGNASVIY